ncbi:MAG: GyrI-like domain-containing protein [Bacillus subtilis]|nr:GyrI-like domain-containing protein [Bacillus subtilis]
MAKTARTPAGTTSSRSSRNTSSTNAPRSVLIGHGYFDKDRGYVYEQWVTIPEDLVLPEKFVKKHYQGGLHASLSCSLADIGEVWKELYNRLENDPVYLHDAGDERGDLCLEECPDYEGFLAPDIPLTSRRLDLLVAVNKRP